MLTCGLCRLPPRSGDNMAMVRVLPGQPHWDDLSANEPEGQTSVCVPACYDCRIDNSEEYFGIPAEMLGPRPAGRPDRMCRLCGIPARAGEDIVLLRICRDDKRYERFAKGEPEDQTSVTIPICQQCRKVEEPAFLKRHDLKAIGRHLI